MYSVRFTSWISGVAFAVTTIAYVAFALGTASMPEHLPTWAIAAVSVVAALAIGGAMAIVVCGGLHLARRHHVSRLSALAIPVISIFIVGFLGTRPIETHAVMLEVGSAPVDQPSIPRTFWLALVVAGAT
jgi:Na+/H+ antiporter NhaA